MAMGSRPEVQTAPAPVVALDVALGMEQMVTALARVPFRHPFAGPSSALSNLGMSVTRETIRAFMGYASALRIPEFRSLELFLDEICKVIMPPFVHSLDVACHQTELGGVPGIIYRHRQEPPLGVILYLHGGGYIGTSPNMYAFFTARVCKETGCAVFVADYRLAPEFPYPAGVEDASSVFAALVELGIPPTRILLAGDSGGGGLANSVILDRENVAPNVTPAGLILFSPEVDLRLDEPSVTENAEHDILPWNIPTAAYLHGADATSRSISPLTADLSGFPPTCVSWGGSEMFRDPIRRYVERLRAAGVATEAHEYDGMFHVFPILMPWLEDSHDVFRNLKSFVNKLVAGAPQWSDAALRRRLGLSPVVS
ncbi:MAG TPA: alpha/beta hydrolase [Acidimicrobiales bacterium]|jgi:monoterpene epsilon-lactone hydrolase|nr:alpha/beta hydrolase [Acidimicrobiales bacterium]